ncbi:MAG: fused MFS/spermidine synthase [Candidatus Brocadiia bacterium]
MAEHQVETDLEGASDLLRGAAILFIAAACGWLIMQMEILGARILAPYFGSAVYVVMGSVIGVFLLSLAVGYTLGGWLSHRSGSQVTLAVCIGVAGAWLCGLPYAVRPLCDALLDAGFDITWGSLLAAFGLFAVPTCLLGTVSPTAVRWLTRDVTRSGFNTGLVFGVSTVASFAGCIATAFYLVRLSMRRTVTGSGLALLALAGAILLHAWLRKPRNQGAGEIA